MKATKILVIHPSNEVQRNIHAILSRFDFEMGYSDDGLNGLIQARHNNPDLIICAANVPVVNGFELCRMIKADEWMRDIPVMLLHEELNLFHISKAKEVGAQAFLVKPYMNNSLIYTVKRGLKRDKLIPNLRTEPTHFEECLTSTSVAVNRQMA